MEKFNKNFASNDYIHPYISQTFKNDSSIKLFRQVSHDQEKFQTPIYKKIAQPTISQQLTRDVSHGYISQYGKQISNHYDINAKSFNKADSFIDHSFKSANFKKSVSFIEDPESRQLQIPSKNIEQQNNTQNNITFLNNDSDDEDSIKLKQKYQSADSPKDERSIQEEYLNYKSEDHQLSQNFQAKQSPSQNLQQNRLNKESQQIIQKLQNQYEQSLEIEKLRNDIKVYEKNLKKMQEEIKLLKSNKDKPQSNWQSKLKQNYQKILQTRIEPKFQQKIEKENEPPQMPKSAQKQRMDSVIARAKQLNEQLKESKLDWQSNKILTTPQKEEKKQKNILSGLKGLNLSLQRYDMQQIKNGEEIWQPDIKKIYNSTSNLRIKNNFLSKQ